MEFVEQYTELFVWRNIKLVHVPILETYYNYPAFPAYGITESLPTSGLPIAIEDDNLCYCTDHHIIASTAHRNNRGEDQANSHPHGGLITFRTMGSVSTTQLSLMDSSDAAHPCIDTACSSRMHTMVADKQHGLRRLRHNDNRIFYQNDNIVTENTSMSREICTNVFFFPDNKIETMRKRYVLKRNGSPNADNGDQISQCLAADQSGMLTETGQSLPVLCRHDGDEPNKTKGNKSGNISLSRTCDEMQYSSQVLNYQEVNFVNCPSFQGNLCTMHKSSNESCIFSTTVNDDPATVRQTDDIYTSNYHDSTITSISCSRGRGDIEDPGSCLSHLGLSKLVTMCPISEKEQPQNRFTYTDSVMKQIPLPTRKHARDADQHQDLKNFRQNDNRIADQRGKGVFENTSKMIEVCSNVIFFPDNKNGAMPKRYGPKKLGSLNTDISDQESLSFRLNRREKMHNSTDEFNRNLAQQDNSMSFKDTLFREEKISNKSHVNIRRTPENSCHYLLNIDWTSLKSQQGTMAKGLYSLRTNITEDNRMSLHFQFKCYSPPQLDFDNIF